MQSSHRSGRSESSTLGIRRHPGTTAAAVRLVGLGILNALVAQEPMVGITEGANVAIFGSSILLMVIGFAPGRTLEAFERRKAEDFEMF